jgi:hypothetical protein
MPIRTFALVAVATTLALGACNPDTSTSNDNHVTTPTGLNSDRSAQRAQPAAPSDQDRSANATATTPPDADNTAMNKQDRDGNTLTPIDQKEDSSDLAITASIRREILKTDGLSTNADNVKVITADGHVTLRGVVEDEAERDSVESIAERIAGADHVEDQLQVDADKK